MRHYEQYNHYKQKREVSRTAQLSKMTAINMHKRILLNTDLNILSQELEIEQNQRITYTIYNKGYISCLHTDQSLNPEKFRSNID